MGKRISIVPIYGRDYSSKAKVKEALDANTDFRVADMSSQWDGKACNLRDLKQDGVEEVTVRYGGLRKVAVFKI